MSMSKEMANGQSLMKEEKLSRFSLMYVILQGHNVMAGFLDYIRVKCLKLQKISARCIHRQNTPQIMLQNSIMLVCNS